MCNTLDMDMKGGWMEYATTYDDFFLDGTAACFDAHVGYLKQVRKIVESTFQTPLPQYAFATHAN